MRFTLFITVLLLVALQACKKTDSDLPGAAPGTVKPVPPPPGFMFPRSYTAGNPNVGFNVWVDEKDATSRFSSDFFFKKEPQDILASVVLKLVNPNTVEIIDGTGQFEYETAGYFFFRDTLFLVYPGRINDTTPFAIGNYDGFVLSANKMYVSGKTGNPSSWARIKGDNIFTLTYQQIYNRYVNELHYFSELDTVAIENSWYNFK